VIQSVEGYEPHIIIFRKVGTVPGRGGRNQFTARYVESGGAHNHLSGDGPFPMHALCHLDDAAAEEAFAMGEAMKGNLNGANQ
jgi:hypothetical protein